MENKQTLLPSDGNDVVMIQLDRPRELRLGHKALKRFSALTGCSLQDMEAELRHYDKMACLMYVMLAADAEKHGETLTVEQVDDLLDNVPVNRQLALCNAAIVAAFAENADGEAQEADPPQAAGTGDGA